jgi:hypothetical protein
MYKGSGLQYTDRILNNPMLGLKILNYLHGHLHQGVSSVQITVASCIGPTVFSARRASKDDIEVATIKICHMVVPPILDITEISGGKLNVVIH